MSGEINTSDSPIYNFLPLTSHSVTLGVKAEQNAHIALSSEQNGDSVPFVEIFLGGWNNSKSAIRYNREKPDKAEANTPSVLSLTEEQTFVVTWTPEGLITVKVKGAQEPFMSWQCETPFPIRYFGVRTAWGWTGTWKIDGVKELHTPDSFDYQWFPVHNTTVNFAVKAKHDAHVILSGSATEENPVYEIFLGGWDNTKSAIRFNKEKPDVAVSEGVALSEGEYRYFWINLSTAGIKVGRAGETEPFMQWENPELFIVSHYGIRTHWGANGSWRFGIPTSDAGLVAPIAPIAPTTSVDATWVAAANGEIPEGALVGGNDGGSPVYVARASHEDIVIPGKLVAGHEVAYVPYGGEEHSKDSYEVLVISPESVSWVESSGETVPPNAIPAGAAEDGEVLYVGRANHEDTVTVGKFHPSHGTVYISFGGKEVGNEVFQVLVKN